MHPTFTSLTASKNAETCTRASGAPLRTVARRIAFAGASLVALSCADAADSDTTALAASVTPEPAPLGAQALTAPETPEAQTQQTMPATPAASPPAMPTPIAPSSAAPIAEAPEGVPNAMATEVTSIDSPPAPAMSASSAAPGPEQPAATASASSSASPPPPTATAEPNVPVPSMPAPSMSAPTPMPTVDQPPLCLRGSGALGRGLSASSCVRLAGGTAACWDANNSGNAAGLTFHGGGEPEAVIQTSGMGYTYAGCVITEKSELQCGFQGALDRQPLDVGGRPVYVVSGQNHRCVLVESSGAHKVLCGSINQPTFTEVTGIPAGRIMSLDAGYREGCAALEDGSVYCWLHESGSFTVGDGNGNFVASQMNFSGPAAFVSTAEYRVCVALEAGGAECNSQTEAWKLPTLYAGNTVIDIASGRDHTCFLLEGGRMHCANSRESSPGAGTATPYVDLVAGWQSWTCGATATGEVECFPFGNQAQATAVALPGGAKAEPSACREP